MSRKIYLKNPERLLGSMLAIICMIILLMFSVQSVSLGSTTEEYVSVYVCKGDTLWSIAKDYYNETDVRNRVSEIKEINNLVNSSIKEGQELLLVKR